MFSMRCISKAVLLVVAAFALSGTMTAVASAEKTEWLLNGESVTKSTPVTDSTTVFTIRRYKKEEQETYKCTASGKGTVNAKGAGTITEWKLTACSRSVEGGAPTCETGTLSGPTTTNLPWTTQLAPEETFLEPHIVNKVGSLGFAWECKVNVLGLHLVYKVTCGNDTEENTLEHGELSQVWEVWQRLIEVPCKVTLGSKEVEETYVALTGTNKIKAENKELVLSFK